MVADSKMIDNQIKSIRKQYGKLITRDTVTKDDEIAGTFVSDERELSNKTTFEIEVIKGKKQLSALIGAKVGDTVILKTKGLFKEDHDNQKYLGVSHDDAHGLDIEVSLNIEDRKSVV